jgi:DNA-binding transcriptional ArsR family regulator
VVAVASIVDVATRSQIYQHLKELRKNGYVDEKFEMALVRKLA